MMQRPRIALLFSQSAANATLSYQHGWPRALMACQHFDATPVNLAGRALSDRVEIAKRLATGRFDAIVMLHSVFSNAQELRGPLLWLLARLSPPKVYFVGNEYKLMPEKMSFCRQLGVALLVTQSNDPRVLALYRDALGCAVTSIPNTGFDSSVFRPTTLLRERKIDIGYRSYEAPLYLGNNEKQEIAQAWAIAGERHGFKVDISMAPADRFDTAGYAAFLNRCRAQIGTESGGDYFDLEDTVRKRVNGYVQGHPSATWPDIKRDIFATLPQGIPMRIISGRQVEAAACKTVQILFEGRYNEFLRPDEHYIPLRKDLSNIAEAAEKLRDYDLCDDLVRNAYDLAMSEFTYERLADRFARALQPIL